MQHIQASEVSEAPQTDAFDDLIPRLQAVFTANINGGTEPLFTTDAGDIWEAYLHSFPEGHERQYHNCHACRQFIQRFGSLVTIDKAGFTSPAMWRTESAPYPYQKAVSNMATRVRRAKVTGVFMSSESTWGIPTTGNWHHFAVRPHPSMIFHRTIQTAGQAMAEKREDFKTVIHALTEFNKSYTATAVRLLKSDSLYRSEKVLGQAEWLHNIHIARDDTYNTNKANIVWRAIATAPAGFCHPRSSMIGTLLEDIAAGKDYTEVARAFAAKMHPLQYQRPQAAPTAGAIAAAEKIVAQLNASGSLARRFARLDEVQALWRPIDRGFTQRSAGVFSHLQPKGMATHTMSIPAQTMTWEKFQRTVLPTAEQIEFKTQANGPYTALVTAVNADAPPILQWDNEGARNPVSWYFWNGGSTSGSFCLPAEQLITVDAITFKPSMWNGGHEHQGKGVMLVLSGARETRNAGNALFPEILKSEFHGIRSVIEDYSRAATIEGMQQPHAAGIMFSKGNSDWNAYLRVWTSGHPMDYRLDRWD